MTHQSPSLVPHIRGLLIHSRKINRRRNEQKVSGKHSVVGPLDRSSGMMELGEFFPFSERDTEMDGSKPFCLHIHAGS